MIRAASSQLAAKARSSSGLEVVELAPNDESVPVPSSLALQQSPPPLVARPPLVAIVLHIGHGVP